MCGQIERSHAVSSAAAHMESTWSAAYVARAYTLLQEIHATHMQLNMMFYVIHGFYVHM